MCKGIHDDVIKWKHFPRYWPFVRGIHRSPVNSPHKGQWRGALVFFYYLRLNKRLSNQLWGWWFETPPCPLWRHCNGFHFDFLLIVSEDAFDLILSVHRRPLLLTRIVLRDHIHCYVGIVSTCPYHSFKGDIVNRRLKLVCLYIYLCQNKTYQRYINFDYYAYPRSAKVSIGFNWLILTHWD